MKRARFTEEQIVGVLREHEAGAKTADLARKSTASPEAKLYNWKAKYGGMDVPEAKPNLHHRLRVRFAGYSGSRIVFTNGLTTLSIKDSSLI